MAQNKMVDLRNHLFTALERLNDETLTEEQMNLEFEKAKAIAAIAKPLVETAKIEQQFLKESGQFRGSEFFGDSKKALD